MPGPILGPTCTGGAGGKTPFFSSTIPSAGSRPAVLFWVVKTLVETRRPEEEEEGGSVEWLAGYFANKIDQIRVDGRRAYWIQSHLIRHSAWSCFMGKV